VSFQAIVIGAGVDSLVAAHLLAGVGHRVLVIAEHPTPAQEFGWVPPHVVGELKLSVKVEAPDPWASVVLPGGRTLDLWRDVRRTCASLKAISEKDAARWPDFCRRMAALARLFERMYGEPPTDPLNLRLAVRVRGLGREGMVDLMRVLPMSVAELLDEWFECDALKGALGAMGVLHIQQGPRSGGTAFRFLHHHVGSPEGVFRPPRTNLGTALSQRPGVQLKQAEVRRIRIGAGRVEGIVLDNGEELAAPLVLSGVDPRRTLLELADAGWLDPELARSLNGIRRRGVAARIAFKGADRKSRVFAPSLDYLERAYDDVKYGRISREPYVEAYATEEGVEAHVQYVPYDAQGDVADVARRLLPDLENAPAVVHRPADLERQEGWPQGQPYHAELALDQALWMRPLPQLAQYRTPVDGLWLCGPGMHPGGGVAGASGYNCARAVLKQNR
jgi:phytoene dehydrogenase-like protein